MILFILRRAGTGLLLALLVTVITFLLLSFSFDSIARTVAGPAASEETVRGVADRLGFTNPILNQYAQWLGGVLRGDFGTSYFSGENVVAAISTRLAVTLSVVVVSLVFTVVVSVILGVWAAARGGLVDRIVQIGIIIGYIVPGLLLAIGLVYVFAVSLKWLPATGYTPLSSNPVAWMRSIVLPAIVLSVAGAANLTSQIRGAMIDELRKDYVRTLRMRGIGLVPITLKHALRNAAGPALTVVSLEFVALFGGALIIESVFALPGIGVYGFNAALSGDLPVILALTVFSVMLVIIVNLVTDLLNGWLNPKARLA